MEKQFKNWLSINVRLCTWLTFVIIILLAACKAPGKATAEVKVPELITDGSFRKPVIDKDLYNATTESVPLDTIYVFKDTLHVLTKRVQGCDADNFTLIWNGNMAKSLPPQTKVKLFQATDAACKERHKFDLIFNLKPLRYKQDSSSHKTTIVGVGGWKEQVKYEF